MRRITLYLRLISGQTEEPKQIRTPGSTFCSRQYSLISFEIWFCVDWDHWTGYAYADVARFDWAGALSSE